MLTHLNTYIHIQSHSFSQGPMTLTHVCVSFSTAVFHYTPPPHHQGWSGGTQDGMSVKAWEREGRSWACSHRPDSRLRAHNKDLCTGARHPGGWSANTHEYKYIQQHMCAYLHKQYTIHPDIDILCLQVCEWVKDWLHNIKKEFKSKNKETMVHKQTFG